MDSVSTRENLKDWQKIRRLKKWLNPLTPEKFTHLDTDEKKRILKAKRALDLYLYKYDFAKFCLEVLHAESWGQVPCKWAKLHYDLCRFMRRCKNLKINAFILVPRFHLKTQICTIFYRLWRVVHDPELCSLIVSGTLELSKGTARTVRAELEGNNKLRDLYGHVLPDWISNDRKNKWSETQFSVARTTNYPQCTVEAVGVEATVTGKHFGEISMDDLVTPENSTTPEQCSKVILQFKYFVSVVNPNDGRFIVVGTPYNDGDLYSFLREPEIIKTFKTFIRPVYDSNGKPIWPEMYSEAKLREMATTQGPYIFSAQYLLDCVPEEQQEFKSSWLKFYIELPKDINGNEIRVQKYCLVDPITAKPTNSDSKDRGVIFVLGVDKAKNWYVLDYKLYPRAKESEMFNGIFTLADRWNFNVVGWESDAYQVQGKYNLEEEIARRGKPLRVIALRTGGKKKELRIRGLIPYFERGQIHIKNWMTELITELLRFPYGVTKDIIDILSYAPQLIDKHRPVSFSQKQSMFKSRNPRYW